MTKVDLQLLAFARIQVGATLIQLRDMLEYYDELMCEMKRTGRGLQDFAEDRELLRLCCRDLSRFVRRTEFVGNPLSSLLDT